MGVNLSVKNVPAEQVELLKQRAKRNHRSLQGELLAIIEKVTAPKTIEELSDYVQTFELTRKREAVRMIREDRDR